MGETVMIHGKPVAVDWSPAAARAMAARTQPLLAEMELYFSCLIRKRVRFPNDAEAARFVNATPRLRVGFRPVMTASCRVDPEQDKPGLEDFTIVNPAAFVPRWLTIDFRKGEWTGEFGY